MSRLHRDMSNKLSQLLKDKNGEPQHKSNSWRLTYLTYSHVAWIYLLIQTRNNCNNMTVAAMLCTTRWQHFNTVTKSVHHVEPTQDVAQIHQSLCSQPQSSHHSCQQTQLSCNSCTQTVYPLNRCTTKNTNSVIDVSGLTLISDISK